MPLNSNRLRRATAAFAALPWPVLYALIYAAVALSHLTLLRLPYYWDEGGYYIPAALDFYHHGWLVPHYTNGHPPLPNVVLGTLWHIVGFHILATRLAVCGFAAAGLLAVFRLTQRLLDPAAAIAVTFLTAAYPIWFAQSTLAQADIFAAAFTLWAFAVYLPTAQLATGNWQLTTDSQNRTSNRRLCLIAALFSLAALSKETSIVDPAALAALQLALLLHHRRNPPLRREHLRWLAALSFPVLPLAAWFAYHHHVTGFTFGNPQFLRYNATANFTAAHILLALRYRFIHLFWERNIWLPILLAFATLLIPRHTVAAHQTPSLDLPPTPASDLPQSRVPYLERNSSASKPALRPPHLPPAVLLTIAVLIVATWIFFSVLGGALLTRYLLPVYPLILLVCVAVWRAQTRWWPVLAAVTAAAFISALWLNPPTSFAPEDNLTYRDMIVVQQQAIDFVAQHYPHATVLTAWPVSADIFNPELGYVTHPIRAFTIEDFTLPQIQKAAQQPGDYDTAIVFTTHFLPANLRNWLLQHPDTSRGRQFAATGDLSPAQIAAVLHGRVVFERERGGEWAAVLRFDRSYEALIRLKYTHASIPAP